eukprot:SAG31_NODE_560_length_14088_cov_10.467010_2_plen_180_part_00
MTGPKSMTVSQPVERIPLWHKAGGLTIIASEPTLRVDDQDWSELTLEAFPHDTQAVESTTVRTVVDRGESKARTTISMHTNHDLNQMGFEISEADDHAERAWVLRVHLAPGERVQQATIDGMVSASDAVDHLSPVSESELDTFTPFGGKGARPAPKAGFVAEIMLPRSSAQRTVQLSMA